MHLISICLVLASNSVLYIYKETLKTLQRKQKEAFREETL